MREKHPVAQLFKRGLARALFWLCENFPSNDNERLGISGEVIDTQWKSEKGAHCGIVRESGENDIWNTIFVLPIASLKSTRANQIGTTVEIKSFSIGDLTISQTVNMKPPEPVREHPQGPNWVDVMTKVHQGIGRRPSVSETIPLVPNS